MQFIPFVDGDDVDLSVAAAPVAVEDPHSGFGEPPDGQVLSVLAQCVAGRLRCGRSFRFRCPRRPRRPRFLRLLRLLRCGDFGRSTGSSGCRACVPRCALLAASGVLGSSAVLCGVHPVPPPAPTVTPPRRSIGSWWITARLWITRSPARATHCSGRVESTAPESTPRRRPESPARPGPTTSSSTRSRPRP